MGEVKRYEARIKVEGAYFAEAANGDYVLHSDYARLEREHAAAQAELTHLLAVEAAAVALLDALQEMQFDQFTVISAPRVRVNELSEACGRKG